MLHLKVGKAAKTFYPAVSDDATARLGNAGTTWGNTPPQQIAELHTEFLQFLSKSNARQWWRNFYLAMREGREANDIDWDFALKIAQIEEDAWEQGFEAVGEAIADLQAEGVMTGYHLHEEFEWDAQTSTFRVAQFQLSKPELLERIVARAEDAFDDALKLGRGNTLTEQSPEYLILRRVFSSFRKDAERVALDFNDVANELARNLEEQV